GYVVPRPEGADGVDGVGLPWGFVRPVPHHPGEPQRDPARVPGTGLDAVQCDLDDQLRPDHHDSAPTLFGPARRWLSKLQQTLGLPGQYGVRQPLEGFAEHDSAASDGVPRAQMQIGQPALAAAVAPFGAQYQEVQGVPGLDLDPLAAAPACAVGCVEGLNND